jgi:hypothetical protein
MANRFLTPDFSEIESPLVIVSYELPSGLLRYLSGAIGELMHDENWEDFGDASINQTVQKFIECLSVPTYA